MHLHNLTIPERIALHDALNRAQLAVMSVANEPRCRPDTALKRELDALEEELALRIEQTREAIVSARPTDREERFRRVEFVLHDFSELGGLGSRFETFESFVALVAEEVATLKDAR